MLVKVKPSMARTPASTARELLAASFSGMVFGFHEDGGQESYSSSDGSQENEATFDMEDDQEEDEKDKLFWENQNQILQVMIDITD